MRTLREDGVRKVLGGLTSAEEVISVTLADIN
jgi:type II secretory ATPase GspE/PulE/Tfp pilus assembly ATPase PilB-like protein